MIQIIWNYFGFRGHIIFSWIWYYILDVNITYRILMWAASVRAASIRASPERVGYSWIASSLIVGTVWFPSILVSFTLKIKEIALIMYKDFDENLIERLFLIFYQQYLLFQLYMWFYILQITIFVCNKQEYILFFIYNAVL